MNHDQARRRIMSFADLATAQAPNLYHLLSRVGALRRRRRAARIAQNAGWFGAGVVVGTGVATLLMPSSGAEMRRRVSTGARRMRQYVTSKSNGAAHKETS